MPPAFCNKNMNAFFFQNKPSSTPRNGCDSVACPAHTSSPNGVHPCVPCLFTQLNPYLGQRQCNKLLPEKDVLDNFFARTRGDEWTGEVAGWGTPDIPPCEYTGVHCNLEYHVISIELNDKNLQGYFPETLAQLPFLETLDLGNNDITGQIPADLAQLANLKHLDISGNKLVGFVPHTLCIKLHLNGNGERNHEFDCDTVACPMGTYSPIGRAASKQEVSSHDSPHYVCMPCGDGDPSHSYVGGKVCLNHSYVSGSALQNGIWWLFAITVFILLIIPLFLALSRPRPPSSALPPGLMWIKRLGRKKKSIKEKYLVEEDMDEHSFYDESKDLQIKPNEIGVSGFNSMQTNPYARRQSPSKSNSGSNLMGVEYRHHPPPERSVSSGSFRADRRPSADHLSVSSGNMASVSSIPRRASLSGPTHTNSFQQETQPVAPTVAPTFVPTMMDPHDDPEPESEPESRTSPRPDLSPVDSSTPLDDDDRMELAELPNLHDDANLQQSEGEEETKETREIPRGNSGGNSSMADVWLDVPQMK
mmetsp:Transcript_7104/g.10857  ORF Transcript_7104/g.10857 Transcript_7104/m.10857 type:complete len:533 (+) Transcript_7104:853-2451(+)